MHRGNMPLDGGNLLLSPAELSALNLTSKQQSRFIRRIYGAEEFVKNLQRYILWIADEHLDEAQQIPVILDRIEKVKTWRLATSGSNAKNMASKPHQMGQLRKTNIAKNQAIILSCFSSPNRPYLPVGIINNHATITHKMFALYDASLRNLSIISSNIHLVWIRTVCGQLGTATSYSSNLGWNTFPVPALTEQNKTDLTRCAENILLARESHFPATIAELYHPKHMPANLRHAHDRNDETLERIYIGRRFHNDTERLEKLFQMYTDLTTGKTTSTGKPNP